MNHRTNCSRTKKRRSIRLPDYDYSQPGGAYYVTLCTRQKVLLFGEVRDGAMILSSSGEIVEQEWRRSAEIRSEIHLDAYVIMPNHMHAVVFIVPQAGSAPLSAVRRGGSPSECVPTFPAQTTGRDVDISAFRVVKRTGDRLVAPTEERPRGPGRKSLAALVAGFKAATTKRINLVRETASLSVWQRNYYERVIRDEEELNRIRQYISENPLRWHYDRDNPEALADIDADPWA